MNTNVKSEHEWICATVEKNVLKNIIIHDDDTQNKQKEKVYHIVFEC